MSYYLQASFDFEKKITIKLNVNEICNYYLHDFDQELAICSIFLHLSKAGV